ncbi:MAG: ATP-binding protein, partial [Thermodesulfobacteriota bacterium]
GAKGAFLRLHNQKTGTLDVAAACGLGGRYLFKGPVSAERSLTDQLLRNKVLLIDDIWMAPRVQYPQEAWNEGVRMMVDAALVIGQEVVGLLRVYFDRKRKFTEEELDFLVAVAEQCATAIYKARLIESQRAQYQSLAQRTEQLSALGRLAAGLAHEINNPLAGVLLYASNMAKKVPPDSPFKEGLEVIIHQTARCKKIIQGLLEFSREREPNMAWGDLNRVVQRALSILENEFHLRRVRVTLKLSEGVPPLRLDESQVEQVVVNLLLNASQAVSEGGRVMVETRVDQETGFVYLEIEDDGCGMSEQQVGRIFEPFFSTKPNGTGLGLAVSYGIIKNHLWDIEVSSRPGQGSRFTVVIPRSSREAGDA